jgi:coatomer subunit epsilon
MDPYSADGELVNIHNAYHQAQYAKVIDFDTSAFSSDNEVPAQLLKLRAKIALGQYTEVIQDVKGKESTPDFAAARILAEYLKNGKDDVIEKGAQLASKEGDNLGVQLLIGTLLGRAGRTEEALALLSKHQGSLDMLAVPSHYLWCFTE